MGGTEEFRLFHVTSVVDEIEIVLILILVIVIILDGARADEQQRCFGVQLPRLTGKLQGQRDRHPVARALRWVGTSAKQSAHAGDVAFRGGQTERRGAVVASS